MSAVAPPGQRAMALAVLTLSGNLLGYALGPPALGAVSDAAASADASAAVRTVHVSDDFRRYVVDLVVATRRSNPRWPHCSATSPAARRNFTSPNA